VRLLEPDDGSGWVKIVNELGQDGLVPASYIELATSNPVGTTRAPLGEAKTSRSAEVGKLKRKSAIG
jgi:formin-binding protein 1